jgi:hypothetical protein
VLREPFPLGAVVYRNVSPFGATLRAPNFEMPL